MTIDHAIEKYHLNSDNSQYIKELSEFMETGHPFEFMRLKSQQLGSMKMSASNLTKLYWQCRGYSENEAMTKISEIQGSRTSIKKRIDKLISEGYSKKEASLKMKEWSEFKSKSVSDSHKRAQEKDPSYLKSMSHHCPEFWIKKGFSEEDARIEANKVCENNRKKFREKLDSGEIKKGWNNTTIEYYLKQGLSLDDAKLALIDRQKTFTLEKCISKYGELEGKRRWKERQDKWKDSIYSGESSIAVGTSKICEEFSSNFDITREFFIRTSEKCYIFDLRKNKMLIEFNGDFWHCNPSIYSSDFLHPIKKMTAQEIWDYDKEKIAIAESKGYTVLTVWESEYKQNPEHTINKCKQFLNS